MTILHANWAPNILNLWKFYYTGKQGKGNGYRDAFNKDKNIRLITNTIVMLSGVYYKGI